MKAESLDRITLNPEIFGGKPIIRGVRIKVSNIIEFLAAGMTYEEILTDYPYLALQDMQAALLFTSMKLNHLVLHAA